MESRIAKSPTARFEVRFSLRAESEHVGSRARRRSRGGAGTTARARPRASAGVLSVCLPVDARSLSVPCPSRSVARAAPAPATASSSSGSRSGCVMPAWCHHVSRPRDRTSRVVVETSQHQQPSGARARVCAWDAISSAALVVGCVLVMPLGVWALARGAARRDASRPCAVGTLVDRSPPRNHLLHLFLLLLRRLSSFLRLLLSRVSSPLYLRSSVFCILSSGWCHRPGGGIFRLPSSVFWLGQVVLEEDGEKNCYIAEVRSTRGVIVTSW